MSVTYGGDSITFADGSVNSSGFIGHRNRIINGAMVIDQRNAGASATPATNTYTVDRWQYQSNLASKFQIGQNLNSITAPTGFTKYLGFQTAAAVSVAAGDYHAFVQVIEGYNVADFGWGTASASTVTLSFWVRSSLTGTFGGTLQGISGTYRSYPFTYTISTANTWTYITVTVPGDTSAPSGGWLTNNGMGLNIWFGLGCGTTYSAAAGSWSSNNYLTTTGATSVVGTLGATFYITGVQLERGSTASSFEYRPYGTELALCQRYYYQISYGVSSQTSMIGFCRSAGVCYFNLTNPVIMRTTPIVAFTGTAPAWNDGANNYALNSPTAIDGTFNNSFYASMTGATAFRPGQIFGGSGGSGVTTFTTEL
jgi:hypothetical protein